MSKLQQLENLNQNIIKCRKCPRLAEYIKHIAREKVKRFSDQEYWGRPLPGFGDFNASLLIVGLAPAAHGGNRTGRMFTGDSSADWVAKVLYKNGFATQPTSEKIGDGFALKNAYITAVTRCAPPQNKPLKEELNNCSIYLKKELSILPNIKVIVCLGKVAFDSCCRILNIRKVGFSHCNIISHKKWKVISSYHPSRQNTQTGRLKWSEWNSVFVKAKKILN